MSKGSTVLFDAVGPRRSPATAPGYLAGRAPRNKGMQYPPDPPRQEEIILVMSRAGQPTRRPTNHDLGRSGRRTLALHRAQDPLASRLRDVDVGGLG